MPDIFHYIKIGAPPDRVYEALTTAQGIRNWWTRDVVLDSRVGGVGEFGDRNGCADVDFGVPRSSLEMNAE